MKRMLVITLSIFCVVSLTAQNKFIKNTGASYISGENFTNILLEKNYNSVGDINFQDKSLLSIWRLKSNQTECELCQNIYAEMAPTWESKNFNPVEIVMRYMIRPSTNHVEINYTFNIIDNLNDNFLVTKLIEVHTGIEKIIDTHKNSENKSIKKNIHVVPGRMYYIDIVARYNSEKNKTIFQFDSLKITEQIVSGALVFNTKN